ncbi:flavin reductase (DIM6/NTAB) family NADH-FMN oxidoreductase RutF [Natronobacillus azotifigens]|uniref:Flavin reductase family protein n=1 Tax=Natronobacillus azotifigens TaxID=472978 RepID=A0A9J6R8Q8_9BACI|nr:flavin reductase family protein [Natronobacillus azotifigens]MCZ0701699.1 flavin reductase family protein [Natronobacillus azotifigens]
MLSIDPKDLSAKEKYKFLIGSIIPRPIAFVTTLAEDGTLNAAPFSYFSVVSAQPPMISISIQRSGLDQKDTARNILSAKSFVVHIVDEKNVVQVNETAATLPSDQSEVILSGLTPIPSEKIHVPGIKEAKIRMECRLEQAIEIGREAPSADLIIGEIVRFHIDNNIYQDGRIDASKLAAVSRLAGNNYAKIGEIFALERPD